MMNGSERYPSAGEGKPEEKNELEVLRVENRQLKEENRALREVSTKDSLTGIYNRRGLEELANKFFARPEGAGKREGEAKPKTVAVLVMDIDNFKTVNDAYDHATGDRALQGLARFLEENIRAKDVVARWGGDEFVVLFKGATAQNIIDASHAWRPDRENGREEKAELGFKIKLPDGDETTITLSGGITELRPGEDLKEAFNRADQALQNSKRSGRNRITSADDKGI